MNAYSINFQIDRLLDELNATDWLRQNLFEITRTPIYDTYPNQVENALEIAMELQKGKVNIAFLAPMQSGKTGTLNALCNYILPSMGYLKKGQNVIFVTSMRDTDLYNQNFTVLSGNNSLYDFVKREKIHSRIYVLKINKFFQKPDPQRIVEQAGIKLVIRDEDQYGSGDESTFDIGFFNNLRSELPNMPLLSVSATPFDILEAAEHNQDIQIIEGVRPDNYFGISEMLELGIVEENSEFEPVICQTINGGIIYLLTDKMRAYINHLNSFEFGLGIIRVNKLQEGENLRDVVNAGYSGQVIPILIGCGSGCDYNIKEGIARVVQHVCNEGKKIMLIVVNALSAGKDLGQLKQYVRFCIEMRSKQIANAVQGLPGRICGYHNNRDIKVMAKLEILEHYAEFENDYEKFYDSEWRKMLAAIGVYQISTQVSLKWAERTGRKCKVLTSQEFSLDDLRNPGTWKYLPEELYSEPTKRDALMELFEPAFYNNPQKGFKLRIPDVNVRIYTNYGRPKDNRVAKLWNKATTGADYYTITFMKKDYKAGILISNLPPNHPKNVLGFQGIKVVWPDTPYVSKGITEMANGSMYN